MSQLRENLIYIAVIAGRRRRHIDATYDADHITTEAGDKLLTEGGDIITTEGTP